MEYSQGFQYALGWNKRVLSVVGAWPEPDDGIFTKQRSLFCALWMFVIVYLPQSASVTIFWENMDAVIGCLSVNATILIAIAKLLVFRYYKREIRMIIDAMVEDWAILRSKEEYEAMMKTAKSSRVISIISVLLSNSLLTAFVIFQVHLGMIMRNQTGLDPRLSVGLLYSVYLPYDTRKSEFFLLTWFAQLITATFATIIYSGFDTFVSMAVLHICGQLTLVGISLKNLVEETNEVNLIVFWKNLAEIIERHQRLNQLAGVIEYSFSFILLPQVLLCTLILCFQGYVMITSQLDSSVEGNVSVLGTVFIVIYICYTLLHLFVYCYVGDYLLIQSTLMVGWTYYESCWYNLPPEQARSLMFVGHRVHRPLVITAGKFCVFSKCLFLAVLKTSVGYLSMLLTVKKQSLEK